MSDGYILQCGSVTIAIDYWTAPHASAFFLTHMHADHYKGLHNDWCQGTIYCSELTSLLLSQKWPGLTAKVVPVDEPVTIQLPREEILAVTAIDANHCPGAVMFLFEGHCGRVLHTGDFRWEQEVQTQLLQHPALTAGPLSVLVLDNTYCHPRYDFPSRLEACQSIISLIQQHPGMDIVLGIDSLGKEDMLAAIATATGCLIGIRVERLETVRLAGLPERLFTPDMSATHIRALPKWMVTLKLLAKLNRTRATLGIIPTGFACLNSKPRTPMASAAGVLVLPPLPDSHLQQVAPHAAAWSKTAAVLADAGAQQPQQQQVHSDQEQSARNREDLQKEQQQQQQVLQQCHGQQQLEFLSGHQQQSARQTGAMTSTVQQQQEAEQCLSAELCAGILVQQQQDDDHEDMQLFFCARMIEEDVKAYATLVHGAHSRENDVSASEIEAVLPLLKKVPYSLHCSFNELESFVAHLRPHAIVPIVKKSYDSRFPIDPNWHFKHLLGNPQPRSHPSQCQQQEKRRKSYAVRQTVTNIGTPHRMSWQGLLQGCTKAIKQMHKPAKPGLHSACSLSHSQQLQPEPDSKLVTCPAIQGELRGPSATHHSLLVRPEGSGPSCLVGNEMSCVSADSKPDHNFTARGVQQGVAMTERPLQLPQQAATSGLVSGRSSQAEEEAEEESGFGQAGVRLGLDQCQAKLLHETAAVKRRCMPDWGKLNRA